MLRTWSDTASISTNPTVFPILRLETQTDFSMQTTLPTKTPRIEAVDALRGFAVMAILLIHSVEHFIFPVYPAEQLRWLDVLNQGIFSITFSLFAGKAYAIFALLFGSPSISNTPINS